MSGLKVEVDDFVACKEVQNMPIGPRGFLKGARTILHPILYADTKSVMTNMKQSVWMLKNFTSFVMTMTTTRTHVVVAMNPLLIRIHTTKPSISKSPSSTFQPSFEYINQFGCTQKTAVLCSGDDIFDFGNHKIAVCKYDHSKSKYETKCVDHNKQKSMKDAMDEYTCGCCDEDLEYGDHPEYCIT